jgi:hypothetical protein
MVDASPLGSPFSALKVFGGLPEAHGRNEPAAAYDAHGTHHAGIETAANSGDSLESEELADMLHFLDPERVARRQRACRCILSSCP